jgi:transglutaminase-like putative cysteine protease
MTRRISQDFIYEQRFTVGVQTPAETLALGRGTCRDLALLMMEACRSLGMAGIWHCS